MISNFSIGRYGRFGNMLFQIASVIGIARKSGQPYGFLPLINYDHRERFGSTEDIDLNEHFVNRFPTLDKDRKAFYPRNYDWGYHDIYLPKGDWDITGHFQSEKYFIHAIDEVRQALTMKGEPQPKNAIAIHVRRGDYDDRYHPLLREDYYRAAIAKFPPDSYFYVFSDDQDQATQLLQSIGLKPYQLNFRVGFDYLEDFKLMKNCSGFICANSSYSLMAAILSPFEGKKIVCPRNWFGPAWGIPMATADLYPRNSILI